MTPRGIEKETGAEPTTTIRTVYDRPGVVATTWRAEGSDGQDASGAQEGRICDDFVGWMRRDPWEEETGTAMAASDGSGEPAGDGGRREGAV